MTRVISLVLILAAVASAQPVAPTDDNAPCAYWIFFKDKGPDAAARIKEFRKTLPQRTILRRRKAGGRLSDIHDLAVYDPYIDAIRPLVNRIREKSRWLNAVSADLDPQNLQAIESLIFVEKTQAVAHSDPQSSEVQVEDTWRAGEREYRPSPISLDYGPSFEQMEQIDAVWAHEQGYHGEGVIICFLDTGFLTYHHAFDQLNILAAHDFINDDDFVGYDPAQDTPDQPEHGTGCLGTIGGYYPGELIGPAFAASYILCKTEVTSSETAVEEDYYVAGLEWGEWLGADVASSSLSYSDWYTTDDYDGQTCLTTIAANIAFQKGLILCSSIGNSGPGKFTLGAPADSRYSLGIGGVQWNGTLYPHSSWGPTVDGRIKPDVSARAVRTIAASPYTTDGFGRWTGTSLSCPLVAGVIALVIQAHPDWSPAHVKEAIKETASRANRPDIRFGWGVVNAREAINYPSFSGYIVDSTALRGLAADITIRHIDGEEICDVQSDSSGYFIFVNLPDGDYSVMVCVDDYIPYEAAFSVPPSEEFDIYLKPE